MLCSEDETRQENCNSWNKIGTAGEARLATAPPRQGMRTSRSCAPSSDDAHAQWEGKVRRTGSSVPKTIQHKRKDEKKTCLSSLAFRTHDQPLREADRNAFCHRNYSRNALPRDIPARGCHVTMMVRTIMMISILRLLLQTKLMIFILLPTDEARLITIIMIVALIFTVKN